MTEHQKALALANLKAEANGILADRGVPPSHRPFLLEGLSELATVRSMTAGLERVDMEAILSELKVSDRGLLAWVENGKDADPVDAVGVDLEDRSLAGRLARMNAFRGKK